jgi:hypothetical protein
LKTTLICSCLLLALASVVTAQPDAGGRRPPLKIEFERYRIRGDDPMVSKIIKKEEETPGLVDDGLDDPIDPDDTGRGEETSAEVRMYQRRLREAKKLAQKSIRSREFEKVIFHCEEGLKTVQEISGRKELLIINPTALKSYKRDFERWRAAAQEGIIQQEALEDFKRRQIKLEGIIWDEVKPLAILDGNSFEVNDPYKGIRVHKIEKRRVNVIFEFKGREFYYTLEFPE